MNEINECLDVIFKIGELTHLKLINEADSKLLLDDLVTALKDMLLIKTTQD